MRQELSDKFNYGSNYEYNSASIIVPVHQPHYRSVTWNRCASGWISMGAPSTVNSPPNTLRRTVTLTYGMPSRKPRSPLEIGYRYAWLPDQSWAESLITMLTVEHPVRRVSWCEAIAFANKSTFEGLDPVYKTYWSGETPKHDIDCNEGLIVEMNAANGWRLPTEAR